MKNLQDFPRIRLAALPTPIQKLENISRLLDTCLLYTSRCV